MSSYPTRADRTALKNEAIVREQIDIPILSIREINAIMETNGNE